MIAFNDMVRTSLSIQHESQAFTQSKHLGVIDVEGLDKIAHPLSRASGAEDRSNFFFAAGVVTMPPPCDQPSFRSFQLSHPRRLTGLTLHRRPLSYILYRIRQGGYPLGGAERSVHSTSSVGPLLGDVNGKAFWRLLAKHYDVTTRCMSKPKFIEHIWVTSSDIGHYKVGCQYCLKTCVG